MIIIQPLFNYLTYQALRMNECCDVNELNTSSLYWWHTECLLYFICRHGILWFYCNCLSDLSLWNSGKRRRRRAAAKIDGGGFEEIEETTSFEHGLFMQELKFFWTINNQRVYLNNISAYRSHLFFYCIDNIFFHTFCWIFYSTYWQRF